MLVKIVSQHALPRAIHPGFGREKGGELRKERPPKITIRGKYHGERTMPSLNDYLAEIGRNPKAGGKMKSDYMKITINAIRRCLKGFKVTKPPVILHYRFFELSKGKRRDVMNIFAFTDKVVEDALTDCGVIENDNPDWVANTTHEFTWIDAKDEPYIEVIIEEKGAGNVQAKGEKDN